MGPKTMSAKDYGEKKKRMMSVEVKQEIIENNECHEHAGVQVLDLARQHDHTTSTICTILYIFFMHW